MPEDEFFAPEIPSRLHGELAAEPALFPAPAVVSGYSILILDIGGKEISIRVAPNDKPILRQRMRELVRRERRRANNAGSAANTAQQIGIGIGGAMAVGGVVAFSTVAAPLAIGAAIVAGAGGLIAIVGLGTGHWLNAKKFAHEEKVDRYQDAIEELK